MRSALELETTAQPASANCGSISRAIAASRAAKIIFGAPAGLAGGTVILAAFAGRAGFKRQRAASAYGRPSEQADAASPATSNDPRTTNIWMKEWPTMAVAPQDPTRSLL